MGGTNTFAVRSAVGVPRTMFRPRALSEERGPTDYDMRHSAVVSFVWLFNYYNGESRILRGVLNGWGVSPITNVHSGIPFTVTSGSDYNLDGISGNDRPNRIPRVTLSVGHPNRTAKVGEWFNTKAFCDNNGGENVACPSGLTGIGPNSQDGTSGGAILCTVRASTNGTWDSSGISTSTSASFSRRMRRRRTCSISSIWITPERCWAPRLLGSSAQRRATGRATCGSCNLAF